MVTAVWLSMTLRKRFRKKKPIPKVVGTYN